MVLEGRHSFHRVDDLIPMFNRLGVDRCSNSKLKEHINFAMEEKRHDFCLSVEWHAVSVEITARGARLSY